MTMPVACNTCGSFAPARELIAGRWCRVQCVVDNIKTLEMGRDVMERNLVKLVEYVRGIRKRVK